MKHALLWSRPVFCLAVTLLTIFVGTLIPIQASASGTVTNCTEAALRVALAGGGTVTFACDGTITLSNTLVLSANTIFDASQRDVVLDGMLTNRVLTVPSGVTCALTNVKIFNGWHDTAAGGISNAGILHLQRCIVSNNIAGRAGGIHNQGTLSMAQSTLVANRTAKPGPSPAGGLHNVQGATASANACTFYRNFGFVGSAIVCDSNSWLSLINCTFSDNIWTNNASATALGVENAGTRIIRVQLANCTLGPQETIIGTSFSPPTIEVVNSIVPFCAPCFQDTGRNLLSGDPKLGPLTNNGGPTLTMALLPDSPAIDQASLYLSPAEDQRGVARPIGYGPDIGAYESSIIPPPTVIQFATAQLSVNEGSGTAVVPVNRSGNSATAVSVNYAILARTAQPDTDYYGVGGSLSFDRGQTNANILVQLRDDTTHEPDETFDVIFTLGVGLGAIRTNTITIHDNDPVPPAQLSFSHLTQSVSESDGQILLAVERTGAINGVVSAEYFVSGGTATANDYGTPSGTVTFHDRETKKTIPFQVVADGAAEGAETIILGLRNPTGGATVSSLTTTVTIHEAVHTVNTCDESALRAAMAGGGKVTLTCDGTIQLTSPLDVSIGTSLDAAGHQVSISGNNATRLFFVHPGVALTLRGLILTEGTASNAFAIHGQGGGIYNSGGIISAEGCDFLKNSALGARGCCPRAAGGAGMGGAIYNLEAGVVTATNCNFAWNRAVGGDAFFDGNASIVSGGNGAGGAIFNREGLVELQQCTMLSNSVSSGSGSRYGGIDIGDAAQGGAICSADGQLVLARVTLEGNSSKAVWLSGANGGAVSSLGGTLFINDSELSKNRVEGGGGTGFSTQGQPGGWAYGGGIYLAASSARIERTCIRANLSQGGPTIALHQRGGQAFGGGLCCAPGSGMTLENCTLAENQAQPGFGFNAGHLPLEARGGAIFSSGSVLDLSHLTVAWNSAGNDAGTTNIYRGGGIYSESGMVTLRHSIVAHSPFGSNCFGPIIDGGYNLSSDASCSFTALGSANNINPMLGPLLPYGGFSLTRSLLAGSPAIDAIPPGSCAATDQRGRARPFGAGCDIGAFESSPPYTVIGNVRGFLPSTNPIVILSGTNRTPIDATGFFLLDGLTAGPQLLTPTSPECVFVLSNRVLNVGPDAIGPVFFSYRSNALSLVRIAGPAVQGTFAGEAGQTYRVLRSPDFSSWTPWSTNTAQSSGLFQFSEAVVPTEAKRFYRVVRP